MRPANQTPISIPLSSILPVLISEGTVYVNSVLATLNARGSLLGKRFQRRHAQSKLAFRSPTGTADPHGAGGGDRTQANAAIEFTTVISADALSTDSVVETSNTKIGDEESFPYRG